MFTYYSSCYFSVGVVTAENAWSDVVHGAPGRMEHNLETTPLEVETNSESCSGDIVVLHFQNPDFDDMNIGGLEIVFSNPPKYRVLGCRYAMSFFSNSITSF